MRLLRILTYLLTFIGTSSAWAYHVLPVPKNLVSFNSAAGQVLFAQSQYKSSFWKLMPFFTTERGISWCAIASDVMALNALGVEPPLTPTHAPYRIFQQSNFFNNPAAISFMIPAAVYAHGVTLSQNAELLAAYHRRVTTHFARAESEKSFRRDAIQAVSSSNTVILVNFCRQYLGEKGCGHFSPLAAYNAKSDRFLLLDVARYKYPPVWVKTDDLFAAMSKGKDSMSGRSRGYLIVR